MKAPRIMMAAMAVLAMALALCLLLGFVPHALQAFRDAEIRDYPALTGVVKGVASFMLMLWPLTGLIAIGSICAIGYVAVSRRISDQTALLALSAVILVLAVCVVLAMMAALGPLFSYLYGPRDP